MSKTEYLVAYYLPTSDSFKEALEEYNFLQSQCDEMSKKQLRIYRVQEVEIKK